MDPYCVQQVTNDSGNFWLWFAEWSWITGAFVLGYVVGKGLQVLAQKKDGDI